jgi:diguanylate cyclase (GGDEF)-like protein
VTGSGAGTSGNQAAHPSGAGVRRVTCEDVVRGIRVKGPGVVVDAVGVDGDGVVGDGAGARVLLGQALVGRAGDVGAAVVRAWRPRAVQVAVSQAQIEEGVRFTSRLGAELIGRWIATGQGASPTEAQDLAERSTALVRDHFAMHSVVKNYLAWRDTTLRVLGEEAARLGSPRPLVEEVAEVVRASADTSIVNVIREYDAQLGRLQEALVVERAKLRHLALHDPLTGLANRVLLLDRLGLALAGTDRRGERVGVLFVDLNGFKAVNDRFGHAAGDHLLVSVARCLTSLVRASDTVARFGGDEFVIITSVPAAGDGTLVRLAERVRAGIAALTEPGEGLGVTASIGAATGADGDDPEHVLAAADALMYAEKYRGSTCDAAGAARAPGAGHRPVVRTVLPPPGVSRPRMDLREDGVLDGP